MNTPSTVCFLHGWAANHHVFDHLIQALPSDYTYLNLDLPGHGAIDDYPDAFDIVAIADQLAEQIPNQTHLVAWSLGGLIAMYIAARHPHKVKSLVLTSTFAKFLYSEDYLAGLKTPALAKMIDLFGADYPKYMKQFLQLQMMYSPDNKDMVEQLIPAITQYGCPSALKDALSAIEKSDARGILPKIHAPTLLIFGNKDTITPVAMAHYLQENIANSSCYIVDKAAHAVFLSHETEFIDTITPFWKQCNE